MSSKKEYLISAKADAFFADIAKMTGFLARFLNEFWRPPFETKELIKQCYITGYKSVGLITITGFITGIVFTSQSRQPLVDFGATSVLPAIVAIAIIRSLAPLVTALICAGKVGSGIGAELGSMRVTEQIDAMEVSAVNPFKYLVVTRVLATSIMIPVLTIYFGFVCMLGAYVDIYQAEGISFPAFVEGFFQKVNFFDIGSALFRALVFGFTIGIIGSFFGYYTEQGTEGVGRAANKSVVIAMYLLFLEEMLIVASIHLINN